MVQKVKKIIIMFLCIFLIFGIFSKRVEAKAITNNLKEFINSHSGVGTLTQNEIKNKYIIPSQEKNLTVEVWMNAVSAVIQSSEAFSNADDRIKRLDEEFASQWEMSANDKMEENDCYLYWGYMLGSKRIEYENQKNQENANKGKSDEELQKEFDKVYEQYKNLSDEDKKDVIKVSNLHTQMETINNQIQDENKKKVNNEKMAEVENNQINVDQTNSENNDKASEIYKQPKRTSSGNTSEQSLQDMVKDADSFVQKGGVKYNETALQGFSKTFYNIMLTIGVFVAVIVGAIIGIKFMTSGVEEKAEVKKLLVPYVVGCIVVFGGFGIWKILVTILQNI